MLTRRTAIKRAVALIGGAATTPQLGLLSKSFAALTDDSTPRFFDAKQFLMIRQIVDQIIPETDTPGAIGAGVHHFIDLMLADWASPQRQARYVEGLKDFDKRARASGAENFTACSPAQQMALLQTLDEESFAPDAGDTFFMEFKKMVLFAYYSSETGATVELRFQRIPGDYLPCVPLKDIGGGWFWNGYSYGL